MTAEPGPKVMAAETSTDLCQQRVICKLNLQV